MKRCSGVLMPIFSLPNKYGIGSFGKESYRFVDYLQDANQKIWQILPLVQTGYGNSPYSSVSSKSINPYFISVDKLVEEKLITKSQAKSARIEGELIDYGKLYEVRYPLLKIAFERFDKNNVEFKRFVKSKKARDYALFMALKNHFDNKNFYEWDDPFKKRDKIALKKFEKQNREQILFWQFLQFEGQKEWKQLKDYANSKGVYIMGDMPLYVALDSVDVWVNPELFKLDENYLPKKVAGVPPDYFCKEGQLWGNPVYDYNEHKKDGFSWWVNRLKDALKTFDYVRIDHFRGLDRYYEVDSGMQNAIVGEWVDVPKEELFGEIFKNIKNDRIIAEDLGIIDDSVRNLLKRTGFPGMKILSFAFNGDKENLYLPENIEENSVCYTGTHDNDTLKGLITNFDAWDKNNLIVGVISSLKKFNIKANINYERSLIKAIIKLGAKSKANTFIIPVHDMLMLDSSFRINEPGSVKEQNWSVKIKSNLLNKKAFKFIKSITGKYNRK